MFEKLRSREITGVVFSQDAFVNYFNMFNYREGVLRKTKDRIFLMSTVWYFHKHLRLMEAFNNELSLYTQFGLINHWYAKYFDQRFRKESSDNTPKIIEMESIYGIILVWFGCLGFSIFVFFMELLSVRFRQVKRVVEFFTY